MKELPSDSDRRQNEPISGPADSRSNQDSRGVDPKVCFLSNLPARLLFREADIQKAEDRDVLKNYDLLKARLQNIRNAQLTGDFQGSFDVDEAMKNLEEAHEALGTPTQRQKYVRGASEQRRKEAIEKLRPHLEMALVDGILEIAEARRLFEIGREVELEDIDIANVVAIALSERSLVSREARTESNRGLTKEEILACSWIPPETAPREKSKESATGGQVSPPTDSSTTRRRATKKRSVRIRPVAPVVQTPVLGLSPKSCSLSAEKPTATLSLKNKGKGLLTGSISCDRPWFTVSKSSFSISSGIENIVVEARERAWPPEASRGKITVTSNGGSERIAVAFVPRGITIRAALAYLFKPWDGV